MSAPQEPAPSRARAKARGPLAALLSLFSSIWLGVFLLSCLFVYSSIGSSGVPLGRGVLEAPYILNPAAWINVRESLELTEFEWFHWWPFDLIIALICVNLVVATLRRIPFNVLNLGVWMIHTGIIVLALGSVWYFSTKLEGDAPIARRVIVASLPGEEPITMIASPGNAAELGTGSRRCTLLVQSITPDWELLSGDDAGVRAYKVTVLVQTPQKQFMRELIADYPQYTEDLIFSPEGDRPVQRAKKVNPDGDPLVDHELQLALQLDAQKHFYLMESAAIVLREIDEQDITHAEHGLLPVRHCPSCAAHLDPAPRNPWIQRPIEKLPHFNDYVASYDHVWLSRSRQDELSLRPLDIDVPPAEDGDPMPDVTFTISEYLAYASMSTRRLAGGDRLDPWVAVELRTTDGRSERFELLALDPARSSVVDGALRFRWASTVEAAAAFSDVRPPTVHFAVRESSVELSTAITSTAGEDDTVAFTPIDGTDFSYRIKSFQNGMEISGRVVSLAIIELEDGQRRFTRWVFDEPSLTRDLPADGDMTAHGMDSPLDDRIQTTYDPGRAGGLQLVGGPGERDLSILLPLPDGGLEQRPIAVNEPIELRPGITLTVSGFIARSRSETRPQIIPEELRDSDVGVQASMARLNVPDGADMQSMQSMHSQWLPYTIYPFQNRQHVLRRFPYRPTVLHLADGRHVEVMLSRQRHDLPAPAALREFQLETHVGGFTGQTSSIRDWRSLVVFDDGGTWSEPLEAHMNHPAEHDGFWFFQAKWDPPDGPRFEGDSGSQGLNYTILGVGNRHGVGVQLLGCCIAVMGMIYAFYVKPYIKRRRRETVYATVRAQAAAPAVHHAPTNGRAPAQSTAPSEEVSS